MGEPVLPILFLGVIAVCLVIITITMTATASRLRLILRRIDAVLPSTEQAVREFRQSFRQARHLLAIANQAMRRVEVVVQRGCDAASGALDRLGFGIGNGAGADPRRHHRGR